MDLRGTGLTPPRHNFCKSDPAAGAPPICRLGLRQLEYTLFQTLDPLLSAPQMRHDVASCAQGKEHLPLPRPSQQAATHHIHQTSPTIPSITNQPGRRGTDFTSGLLQAVTTYQPQRKLPKSLHGQCWTRTTTIHSVTPAIKLAHKHS